MSKRHSEGPKPSLKRVATADEFWGWPEDPKADYYIFGHHTFCTSPDSKPVVGSPLQEVYTKCILYNTGVGVYTHSVETTEGHFTHDHFPLEQCQPRMFYGELRKGVKHKSFFIKLPADT